MSEHPGFTIELEQLDRFEFNVRFDLPEARELTTDEPAPLGQGKGPNPARLVAAAAANCLGASLLYCVAKDQPPAGSLRATAHCDLQRIKGGRLRIGAMQVRLELSDQLSDAARVARCLNLFEDFCVVTASLRQGFPIGVEVVDPSGATLHRSDG